MQPTWLTLSRASKTLFPAFPRLPQQPFPSRSPSRTGPRMQPPGLSQRAQEVGLSSPGWAEASTGRGGQEQMVGLGDGLGPFCPGGEGSRVNAALTTA